MRDHIVSLIVEHLRGALPNLDRESLMAADDLLSVGLGSLGLLEFGEAMEKRTNLEFDTSDLVRLASASVLGIAGLIEEKLVQKFVSAGSTRSVTMLAPHYRARIATFLSVYEDVIAEAARDYVMLFGTSNLTYNVDGSELESCLAANSIRKRALSASFQGVGAAPLALIAQRMKSSAIEAIRLPAIVFEFDPVIVTSESPAFLLSSADTLARLLEKGAELPVVTGSESVVDRLMAPSPIWTLETRGWLPYDLIEQVDCEELWDAIDRRRRTLAARAEVVARVYAGEVEVVPEAVESMLEAMTSLRSMTDRFLVFVPPIQPGMRARFPDLPLATNRLKPIIERIEKEFQCSVWDPAVHNCGLEDEDFMDCNHLAPGGLGVSRFSRALGTWVAAELHR